MFPFSNNTLSNTYSMRPPKDNSSKHMNNDYVNISPDISGENSNVLNIDLNSINFENVSVELALNIVGLQHKLYHEMSQYDIIKYYNDKIKLLNNLNVNLALKILLKHKLKGLDIKVNKSNVMMPSEKSNQKILYSNNSNDSEYGSSYTQSQTKSQTQYKQHPRQNDFKIIQNTNQNQYQIPIATYSNTNQNAFSFPNSNINVRSSNSNPNANPNINLNMNSRLNSNPNLNLSMNSNINSRQNPNMNPNMNLRPNPNLPNMPAQKETFDGRIVSTSSQFDIDSIINSYTQKKSSGLIK